MEETRLPLSPMPHLASADFDASVFAYLPSRRLLTPRLGGGLARFPKSFMWPCPPCSPPTVGCHAATAGFVPEWAAVFQRSRIL